MKIKRASLCQGKGSLTHNMRLFTANNVDKTRTKDNIVFVNIPQQEMYEKLFSGAVSEYNAKQKRNDRKITVSYYEHQFGRSYSPNVLISADKRHSFYEDVVQIGDMKDTGVGTVDAETAKAVLTEYMNGFEQRNPNFKVFCAVLHMDEATPHLHIDYVPIGHYSRGIPIQNGIAQALSEMGFGVGKNAIARWRQSEYEVLKSICMRYEIELAPPKKSVGSKSVELYKEEKRLEEKVEKLREMELASDSTEVPYKKRLIGGGYILTEQEYAEFTAEKKAVSVQRIDAERKVMEAEEIVRQTESRRLVLSDREDAFEKTKASEEKKIQEKLKQTNLDLLDARVAKEKAKELAAEQQDINEVLQKTKAELRKAEEEKHRYREYAFENADLKRKIAAYDQKHSEEVERLTKDFSVKIKNLTDDIADKEKVISEQASGIARLEQFAKDGEQIIAKYPTAVAEEVEKLKQEYAGCVEESKKYLIDVKDNTVTMDIGKLLAGEDESTYFVKVPNTAGRDYLRLNKSEVELTGDNKTISMKLDMGKSYKIYDSEGNLKSERTGAQLSRSYNTKSMYANKNTEVVKYGVGVERVELYNKEQNKLISLGIDSAEKMRTEMLEQGISAGAAELLLKDIYKVLPDNYKEIFNYSAEQSEIVYADIPNIGEYLAQSQLSQKLIGKAECFGELPKYDGGKCCVYDKAANRFTVLPILPRETIAAKLTDMGYSELCAKEIAERVVGSYRDTDMVNEDIEKSEEKPVVPKSFDTNNPELDNMMYHNSKYGTLIVQESGEQYRYMDIDKGTPMADVEKALMKNFGIKDEMSAAEIMKQLAKDGIIEMPAVQKVADVTIGRISTNLVEVKFGGESAVMPKNKMDIGKLEDIGLDKKTADTVIKAFVNAEKNASSPTKQTLQQLKNFAEKAMQAISSKDKNKDIAEKEKPKSGQER